MIEESVEVHSNNVCSRSKRRLHLTTAYLGYTVKYKERGFHGVCLRETVQSNYRKQVALHVARR